MDFPSLFVRLRLSTGHFELYPLCDGIHIHQYYPSSSAEKFKRSRIEFRRLRLLLKPENHYVKPQRIFAKFLVQKTSQQSTVQSIKTHQENISGKWFSSFSDSVRLKMNFSSAEAEDGWIDKYNHLMVDLRDPRYVFLRHEGKVNLLTVKVRWLPDDVVHMADCDRLPPLRFYM